MVLDNQNLIKTYHRVTLSRSSLAVSEETAMESIPSVVQDLLTQCFVHHLLVGVTTAWFGLRVPIVIVKPVVGPQTVVEGVRLVLPSSWVCDQSGGPFL